ncbi:hypothetical protein [Vibrio variabilis]|uniref:hypothetical protein n=1 Tax=Vibrio variabilis TaxID=990271 RepID=UPI001EFA1477|nr:hypothetical protein [Vibrio variabilis]
MSSVQFLYPQMLWLTLPAIGILFWLATSQRASEIMASHLAKALGKSDSRGRNLYWLSPFLLITIIALAGPSFGNAEKPGAQSANARVLVLDMSQSVYATDIKPTRLAQIRYKALDILPLFDQGQTGSSPTPGMLIPSAH